MARTKDVILTPEQKEQMEKEYFEAIKPMEGVNATRNDSESVNQYVSNVSWI